MIAALGALRHDAGLLLGTAWLWIAHLFTPDFIAASEPVLRGATTALMFVLVAVRIFRALSGRPLPADDDFGGSR